MARRSRRGGAQAAPEPRSGVCRMGVYARTSKSYGDDGCSIENQKRIVADHVGRLPDAVVAGYYVDDGFTGTNQDRDAFQRMVADLRAGRIDGVAAKDASRLGRDYVECQTFIRDTLPSLGARLVLVADGVDSKDDAALDGLSLDLKSLLNDLYSRDLSRKIHATFEAARRRGPLILGHVPYGYLRDPEDAHHLVPDPETAPFVRGMFEMSARGEANARIADWLNESGAPTAGRVKYARAGLEPTSKDSRKWHARNVNRMLENQAYAGRVVMHKWTQKLCLGIPHTENDPEDWLVVDGAHEPLVAPEVFDRLRREREERVERARETRAANDRIRQSHPDRLKGKVRCGVCGGPMHICRWIEDGVFWGAEYCCGSNDRGEGGGRHRVAAPLVETVCMDVIRSQVRLAADLDALAAAKVADGTLARKLAEVDGLAAEAEEAVARAEEKAAQLKAEHTRGEVSTADYRRIERMLWGRLAEARRERARLAERRAALEALAEGGAPAVARGAAELADSFSAELAEAAIDTVTYEADGSLTVRLRFGDAFEERRAALEALS